MGRQRDPKREKSFEMYRASGGKMELKEIASALGVPEGTVRAWKKRDNWDNPNVANVAKEIKKNNATLQKMKRNATQELQCNAIKKVVSEPIFESVIENEDLTDKQRLFCLYYVKYWNATKAYQKAYDCSYTVANKNAHALMVNHGVCKEIDRLKKEIAQGIKLDGMAVLQKYIDIAFADMNDYVDFGQRDIPIMTKKGQPVIGPDGNVMTSKETYVAFRDAKEVDGTIISEIKAGKEISIKLSDRMKALEKLEQYYDLLPDHHKRRIQEERLKIEQERLELDKKKAAGECDVDSELVDDWAEAVMEE